MTPSISSNELTPVDLSIAGWLTILCCFSTTGLAQPLYERFDVSSDITVRVNAENPIAPTIFNDRAEIRILTDGVGSGRLTAIFADQDGIDVDALHIGSFAVYSVDATANINGATFFPGDAFAFNGNTQPPILYSRAISIGIAEDINLDAVSLVPGTQTLLLSYDQPFSHPVLGVILPADVVVATRNQPIQSRLFDGSSIPENVNIDGVHWVSDDVLLLSVDIDTSLAGSGSSIQVSDDDIIEYTFSTNTYRTLLNLSEEAHPSWEQADVDGLSALLENGQFRFTTSYREIQESVGTINFTVERINGDARPIQARVFSTDGTAIADEDFIDLVEDISWADGDSTPRNVTLSITDDQVEEGLEQFIVRLIVSSSTSQAVSPNQVLVRILDDDGDFLFSDGFEI